MSKQDYLDRLIDKENCLNCRYWDNSDNGAEGYCRRHAPVLNQIRLARFWNGETEKEADGEPNADWPITMPYDWCGEYEDNPDPESLAETLEWLRSIKSKEA